MSLWDMVVPAITELFLTSLPPSPVADSPVHPPYCSLWGWVPGKLVHIGVQFFHIRIRLQVSRERGTHRA